MIELSKAIVILIHFFWLESLLHRGLSFRHCSLPGYARASKRTENITSTKKKHPISLSYHFLHGTRSSENLMLTNSS